MQIVLIFVTTVNYGGRGIDYSTGSRKLARLRESISREYVEQIAFRTLAYRCALSDHSSKRNNEFLISRVPSPPCFVSCLMDIVLAEWKIK